MKQWLLQKKDQKLIKKMHQANVMVVVQVAQKITVQEEVLQTNQKVHLQEAATLLLQEEADNNLAMQDSINSI